jgi:hypothetical protein
VRWRIGIAAIVPVALLWAACESSRLRTAVEAGFWYEDFPFTFDPSTTRALGGPLTSDEIAAIKRISRAELQGAFSGLNVAVSENHEAFWRVRVRQSLERRRKQLLPNAGETLALGPLGGRSEVNFLEVVSAAIAHAPPGTTRPTLVEGIGRGIGRAAVHELAHAILGASRSMDNRTDADSYEYFSHNRPSQYYGVLHWASARHVLEEKVGRGEE